MELAEKIAAMSDELESHTLEIRRKIHENPELAFHETETSALVCRELERIGISYEKSPVSPGIIATIDGKEPGGFLMLRADMDALPIQEETGLAFQSRKENIMHACGHDVHTANLLAVGEILYRLRDEWIGKVKLVFQPAEERGGGGREMIRAGLMDEMPDACMGMHVLPASQGQFVIGSGYTSAYSDGCRITVHGKSTHSSAPQKGVDAMTIAAMILLSFNSIQAKNISPMEPSTFNVGMISGGSAPNIVADRIEMSGMMRNATPETRKALMDRIETVAKGIAESMGGSCDVEFSEGYPSVYNDPAMTEFAVKTIEANRDMLFGGIGEAPENYIKTGNQLELTAEDFGFFAQKAPSCFLHIGTGNFAAAHNQKFMVDESYIKLCTRTMSLLAVEYLNRQFRA